MHAPAGCAAVLRLRAHPRGDRQTGVRSHVPMLAVRSPHPLLRADREIQDRECAQTKQSPKPYTREVTKPPEGLWQYSGRVEATRAKQNRLHSYEHVRWRWESL